MNNIKFSIIIPAYNAEQTIRNALLSVFNQTYTNYEIIAIDDCSTDNTYNILKEYSNIKLFQTPVNSRQGAARNIGLNHCTGDYLLFLDADDMYYDNDVFEKIVNIIEKENFPDIIYTGIKVTGKRDLTLLPNEENCIKSFRLSQNRWINVTGMCVKNSIIQNNSIRFPEKIRYEDVYFAFLAIEKSNTFTYTDFIAYLYINGDNTSTTAYTYNQSIDTILLIQKLSELKDKIDKENIIYLKQRMLEQVDRLNERIKRVIDFNFEN